MFILRCQSLSDGGVKWIVGLVNLKLRINVWAEERDFKFFDKKMLFNANMDILLLSFLVP